jgi:hypothetical protein
MNRGNFCQSPKAAGFLCRAVAAAKYKRNPRAPWRYICQHHLDSMQLSPIEQKTFRVVHLKPVAA